MRKNYFVVLVSLMILSIIGILGAQAYWIKTSWNNKEEAFYKRELIIISLLLCRKNHSNLLLIHRNIERI